jgi:hypothetical protein
VVPAQVAEARRVEGLLQVHPEHEQVQQDLHVALRLHVAAHDAVAHERLLAAGRGLRHKGGDDRVERTLAGSNRVRQPFVHRERGPAVLERETRPGDHDA